MSKAHYRRKIPSKGTEKKTHFSLAFYKWESIRTNLYCLKIYYLFIHKKAIVITCTKHNYCEIMAYLSVSHNNASRCNKSIMLFLSVDSINIAIAI